MLSERLPEPDGAPVAIKLLGERLVAFRDSQGRIGLLDEFCPHRRVSLAYGRNEESGLRCVYHGWKLDLQGRVVDIPGEPSTSKLAKSIRHTAYPAREAGGIVWTYMGPQKEPPPFPDFLFTKLPAKQVIGFHYRQECNYLQGIEADLDIGHPAYLHSAMVDALADVHRSAMNHDRRPRGFTREESFGMQTVWAWKTEDPDKALFWVDPFVVPCYTLVPGGRTKLRWTWHAWVPIDDEHHWLYYVHYDPEIDPGPDERKRLEQVFGHDLIDPSDDYRSRANVGNMHFLDRDRQRRENFSGIRGIAAQDVAVTQSMGAIVDRSRENVASGDVLVIQLRRYLLKLVRRFMAGEGLPGLRGEFSYPDIDSRMVIAATGTSFAEILAHRDWAWGERGGDPRSVRPAGSPVTRPNSSTGKGPS
jgi:phenylpropionate dioxygenase-like ring-hydroxylating dioxygenase large terminal subunit